ncbi:hypothetical protein RN001_005302 [Aquatica leii]|uniref:Uncharacterized protein n=1 Tax=Aquatica leii TaxID=1421715 RepID=A0AAN7SPT8_9COLE|nr:hypothetical protein RN001_005302 [Aquatica leii]
MPKLMAKEFLKTMARNKNRKEMDTSGNEDSENEIPQAVTLGEKAGTSRQETSESELGPAWEKVDRKKKKVKKAAAKKSKESETEKVGKLSRESNRERYAKDFAEEDCFSFPPVEKKYVTPEKVKGK